MLKYFVIFFLLLPFLSNAQDTAAVKCKLNSETDPFTKEVKLSTGFIPLEGGSVTIDATKAEIDLLFVIEGGGAERCFDNNSTAFIYFEGSRAKLTIRNGGTMNCEGLFHFIFRNTPVTQTNMTKLATQKISKIVFTATSKKEVTVTLGPPDQEIFLSLAKCLAEEAKKLIK